MEGVSARRPVRVAVVLVVVTVVDVETPGNGATGVAHRGATAGDDGAGGGTVDVDGWAREGEVVLDVVMAGG